MTKRELLHQKLLEINPRNDLTIACDTFLDTDQKVDLVLKEVLKFLEIDCGYDVRVKCYY